MKYNVDLVLINPGNRESQFGNVSEYATVAQPLGPAMIASYVRNFGHSVEIIDAEAELWGVEKVVDEVLARKPRLVGITAFTTKMTAGGAILNELYNRAPEIKTMIGGHHPSAIPERTLREERANFAVVGEGYTPTKDLLNALKQDENLQDVLIRGVWYLKDNQIIDNGMAEPLVDLDNLPFPAWDLLPMEKYRAHHWQCWEDKEDHRNSFGLVFSSLGCPFNCGFCSVNVVYGKRGARNMSPKRFVDSIEHLANNYGTRHLEIIDDTFTLNTSRVNAICGEIINRGLEFDAWCFARTDRTDPKMLDNMRKAGINWTFSGLEAGTDETLAGSSKHQNVKQIRDAVKKIKAAGIYMGGNFVFGLPGETNETMSATLDLANELNPEWANFFIPMAYPGTRLYEEARGKGILPRRWTQYGFFAPDAVPLPTEKLTSGELIKFRDAAFVEFFSGERYQNMIQEKFGSDILKKIKKMLEKNLERVPYPEKEKLEI